MSRDRARAALLLWGGLLLFATPATAGRITGTVTSAATGQPVPGVRVDVFNSAGEPTTTQGTTDASGVYLTLGDLPAGDYYALTSNDAGLLDELYNDVACSIDRCNRSFHNFFSGTRIAVGPGTTSGIDFVLTPGGRISGRVTDLGTGRAVPDADVFVYSGYYLEPAVQMRTAADGTYVTGPGLSTGYYTARTHDPGGRHDQAFDNLVPVCYGGTCNDRYWTPILVTQGATTPNVDFVLRWKGPARGDLSGNNRSDILWRNVGGPDTGALFVWLMNGANIAGASYLSPIDTDWVIQGVADFNADGKADILWRNVNADASDAGYLYVWLMNGASVIGAGYTDSQADFGWEIQGVGDLNDDGAADIVWRKVGPGQDTGALFLWLMKGASLIGAKYLDPISTDWQIQGIADFDAYGTNDILWRNMNPGAGDAGKLYIWFLYGTAQVGGPNYTSSQADLGWAVQGAGDLDGDGKSDIVWRKVGPGPDTGALFLWLMDGSFIRGARYLDPIGADWQVQGLGDFNGDRKSDILWRNVNPGAPDADNLYIWMMDGPNVVAGTGYTNSQASFAWDVKSPR